jgi:hypothetical protein
MKNLLNNWSAVCLMLDAGDRLKLCWFPFKNNYKCFEDSIAFSFLPFSNRTPPRLLIIEDAANLKFRPPNY